MMDSHFVEHQIVIDAKLFLWLSQFGAGSQRPNCDNRRTIQHQSQFGALQMLNSYKRVPSKANYVACIESCLEY